MFSETRFSGASLIPPNPKLFGWDRPEVIQLPRVVRSLGYPELLQNWLDGQRLADAANRLTNTWEHFVARYPRLAELASRTFNAQVEPFGDSDEVNHEPASIHFDRSFLSRCQRGHVPSKAGGRGMDPRHITIAIELAVWESTQTRLETATVVAKAQAFAGRIAELLTEDREETAFHLGDALEVLKGFHETPGSGKTQELLHLLAAAASQENVQRASPKLQTGPQPFDQRKLALDQPLLHQLRTFLAMVPYRKAPLALGHLRALHALQGLVDQCISDWASPHPKLSPDPGAELARSLYCRALDRGNRDWPINCILLD